MAPQSPGGKPVLPFLPDHHSGSSLNLRKDENSGLLRPEQVDNPRVRIRLGFDRGAVPEPPRERCVAPRGPKPRSDYAHGQQYYPAPPPARVQPEPARRLG